MTKREKFEIIGTVCVDTATLHIGDPCYQTEGADFSDEFGDAEDVQLILREGDLPQAGAQAIRVITGFGDGMYDVMAKRCTVTGRIKELKIKFF
jgi:hypothetical protein